MYPRQAAEQDMMTVNHHSETVFLVSLVQMRLFLNRGETVSFIIVRPVFLVFGFRWLFFYLEKRGQPHKILRSNIPEPPTFD